MNVDETIRLVLGIQSVGILLSTLELISTGDLVTKQNFHAAGTLMESRVPWRSLLESRRLVFFSTWCRALAAVALLLSAILGIGLLIPVIVLVLSCIHMTWIKKVGGDGADQMFFITIIAAAPALAMGDFEQRLFLWFVTLQATISYITAGVAKLISPVWRSGIAIVKILRTSNYGQPLLANFLARSSFAGLIVCWATMLWEASFPICLLGFEPLTYAVLLIGVSFHLACAIIMGLNDFLWAFVGTYPAVLFVAQSVHSFMNL